MAYVNTNGEVRVGVANKTSRIVTSKHECEITGTLEVADNTFHSFPVNSAVAVKIVAKLVNSICNVRSGANCEIHQGSDK